jgi:hypothetical protein
MARRSARARGPRTRHSASPCRRLPSDDLDHVAFLERVPAADALAVEPRRRPSDERAGARRREVVMDAVGKIRHGCAVRNANGSSSTRPLRRGKTRISPVSAQIASHSRSRLSSSSTDTATAADNGPGDSPRASSSSRPELIVGELVGLRQHDDRMVESTCSARSSARARASGGSRVAVSAARPSPRAEATARRCRR